METVAKVGRANGYDFHLTTDDVPVMKKSEVSTHTNTQAISLFTLPGKQVLSPEFNDIFQSGKSTQGLMKRLVA